MIPFSEIYQRATDRKGGVKNLNKLLPKRANIDILPTLDSHRFLAEMTRCVFQAGFVWKVVDQKWGGFEDVFYSFDPNIILTLSVDGWQEIRRDKRIIRNNQKITSVRENAQFIEDISMNYGTFSTFIAGWPESDLIGLFELLKKRGSRLGGLTGQRFLRNVGKDTFILTKDVVACLKSSGLDIKDSPTSKRELSSIQKTFNQWHVESNLPYMHISKIVAYSVDT